MSIYGGQPCGTISLKKGSSRTAVNETEVAGYVSNGWEREDGVKTVVEEPASTPATETANQEELTKSDVLKMKLGELRDTLIANGADEDLSNFKGIGAKRKEAVHRLFDEDEDE